MQAHMSNVFQSPHLMATIAMLPSLSGDDLERPGQMAEVVNADHGRSVISLARKMLMEWYAIGYNGRPH